MIRPVGWALGLLMFASVTQASQKFVCQYSRMSEGAEIRGTLDFVVSEKVQYQDFGATRDEGNAYFQRESLNVKDAKKYIREGREPSFLAYVVTSAGVDSHTQDTVIFRLTSQKNYYGYRKNESKEQREARKTAVDAMVKIPVYRPEDAYFVRNGINLSLQDQKLNCRVAF